MGSTTPAPPGRSIEHERKEIATVATKEKITSFNFRIPLSDLEKLEEYAKKIGQSPNVIIQLIIKGLLTGTLK